MWFTYMLPLSLTSASRESLRQSHPAQCQRVKKPRYTAGYNCMPYGKETFKGIEGQDRTVLQYTRRMVIQNLDAESLYEIPLMLEEEGLANIVCERLNLGCVKPDMTEWCELVNRQKNLSKSLTIALVGKYVELHDAYLSVVESLNHGGIYNDAEVKIKWVIPRNLLKTILRKLSVMWTEYWFPAVLETGV